MGRTTADVTLLLQRAGEGDTGAARQLFPIVYEELRRLAQHYMQGERSDHTLQPTALVHEAYVRLASPHDVEWANRGHFFRVAAQAMRRILVDHARRRQADKRGGQRRKLPLEEVGPDADLVGDDDYLVALDEAMTGLAGIDPQAARVVELRFFGGLTVEETARVLSISARTVKRDWQTAKGWLHREISRSQ